MINHDSFIAAEEKFKQMKKTIIPQNIVLACIACLIYCSSCELIGLELQQNYNYHASAPDPNVSMTAWEYLNQTRPDTLFALMLKGVRYAGLEEEYSKPNRTYIAMTNNAIYSRSATGVELATSYFVMNKVNGKSATRWEDYPAEQVRNFFKYHILEGVHTYPNITLDNLFCSTLLDGASVSIRMLTINDSRLTFNNYTGTKRAVHARTANIRPSNGVIHVVDQNLIPQ